MKCQEIREQMPDLAAGLAAATSETENHLKSCGPCAEELAGFRQTMALLDEWEVPEPSPYFDTRLNARLREEMAKSAGVWAWLHWFRRPALAVSLALMMAVGITVFHSGDSSMTHQPMAAIEPGTAVGDLQTLDKNSELYSDFDVLDDLQVQQNVSANQ
jgi:anti-sigma factor RsiW